MKKKGISPRMQKAMAWVQLTVLLLSVFVNMVTTAITAEAVNFDSLNSRYSNQEESAGTPDSGDSRSDTKFQLDEVLDSQRFLSNNLTNEFSVQQFQTRYSYTKFSVEFKYSHPSGNPGITNNTPVRGVVGDLWFAPNGSSSKVSTGIIRSTEETGYIVYEEEDIKKLHREYGEGYYYLHIVEVPPGFSPTWAGSAPFFLFRMDSDGYISENYKCFAIHPNAEFGFEIEKKSSDGTQLLEGAEFFLEFYNGSQWVPAKWPSGREVSYETDANGKIKFAFGDIDGMIRATGYGQYRWKETKAPDGYIIPEGEGKYTYFTIDKDFTYQHMPNLTIYNSKTPIPVPEVEVDLEKRDDKNNLLPGAEFELEVYDGSWKSTGKTYTTDSNGKIKLSVTETKDLREKYGDGPYRFKETKAPNGYVIKDNGLSDEFKLDKSGNVKITVINECEPDPDPEVEVEKKDKQTGQRLSGATFIIQSLRSDNTWSQFILAGSPTEFATGSDGKVRITDQNLIRELIKYEGTGNDQKYRFREVKAPNGYRDPHAPSPLNASEPIGGIGDQFSKEFTFAKNNGDTITVEIENEKEPEVEVEVEKRDDKNNLLPGAEFELEVYDGSWKSTGKTYTTDSNGKIKLSVAETKALREKHGDGPYRFRETKAPNGYVIKGNGLSDEFKLDKSGNVKITVINECEPDPDPEVEVEKKDKQTGQRLSGATFIIQSLRSDNTWSQFILAGSPTEFTTGSDGKIRITDQNLIRELIKYEGTGNDQKYRFREVKAPNGYRDPHAPSPLNASEPIGGIGDQFSKEFTFAKNNGDTITVEIENEKEPEVEVEVEKRDEKNNLLPGAEFELEVYDGGWKATGKSYTTDSNGKIKLSVAETKALREKYGDGPYRFKETKAPNGYVIKGNGLSDEFKLDKDGNVKITVINEKEPEPETEIEVEKRDQYGNAVIDAEFELQVKQNGQWIKVYVYSTNSKGKIQIGAAEVARIKADYGNGPYRFKETKAPNGYLINGDGLSEEFTLDKDVSIQMTNEKTPDVEVEKRDKNSGTLLKEATFIVQYTLPGTSNSVWIPLPDTDGKYKELITSNGRVSIPEKLIESMYQALLEGEQVRIREIKAPDGYKDPQAPDGFTTEENNGIGDQFSTKITLEQLRKNRTLTVEVENEKEPEPEIEVEKRDAITNNLIKEATFIIQAQRNNGMWEIYTEDAKSNGLFTTKNGVAVIDDHSLLLSILKNGDSYRGFRIREISSPTNYVDPEAPDAPYYQESAGDPGDRFSVAFDYRDLKDGGKIKLRLDNELPPPPLEREFDFVKADEETKVTLAGAEFVLEYYSEVTKKWVTTGRTFTTQRNGRIEFDEALIRALGNGRYRLKETKAPDGYDLPKDVYSDEFIITDTMVIPPEVTMYNHAEVDRTFELEKIDADTGNPVEGAVFVLQYKSYTGLWHDLPAHTYTTDKNGKIILNEEMLKDIAVNGPWMVRFKEIQAPPGYQLPNDVYTEEFEVGDYILSKDKVVKENKKIPKDRKMVFEKVDADTGKGLFGAEFHLYRVDDPKDVLVATFLTDSDGKIALDESQISKYGKGTYYFLEIKPQTGYELPANPKSSYFEITEDGVVPDYVKMTNRQVEGLDDRLHFRKIDESSKAGLPGAKFALYRSNGTFVKNYSTNAYGNIDIDYDELMSLGDGTYYFVEVEAPAGYVLPDNPKSESFTITKAGVKPSYIEMSNKKKIPANREFTFTKIDAGTGETLKGAVFELQKEVNGKWTDTGKKYTTDSSGKIYLSESDIQVLGEGKYRLKEITAPTGYELPEDLYSEAFVITADKVEPFTTTKTNQKIKNRKVTLKKVDASDANKNLSGAKFVLERKNANGTWSKVDDTVYTTDSNGQIQLTEKQIAALGNGEYHFKETVPPVGYDLPSDPTTGSFTITDDKVTPDVLTKTNVKTPVVTQKPSIEVEKRDATTGELLKEATFIIQSLRSDDTWSRFTATGAPTEFTTVNGVAKITDETLIDALIKYSGTSNDRKYRIREIKAPNGYKDPQAPNPVSSKEAIGGIGDSFSQEFTITNNSQGIITVRVNNTLAEKPKEHKLTLKKIDADTEAPIKGAVFELWGLGKQGNWIKASAKSFETDAKGEMILPESTINFLIENGYTKVRFKEVSVPSPYLLPQGDEAFTAISDLLADRFSPDTLTMKNVREKVTDRTFTLKKVDAEDKNVALSGAEFVLERQNANGTWSQVSTKVYRTDNSGKIQLVESEIAGLGNGTYRFKETKAPTGYDLPDDLYSLSFEISKEMVDPQEITKKNWQTPVVSENREIILTKTDQKTGKALPGVEFAIQALRSNGTWSSTYSLLSKKDWRFTTDAKGQIIINDELYPGMIDEMLNDYKTSSNVQSIRFRESKALPGYVDPKFTTENEAQGKPGDDFSVVIDMDKLAADNHLTLQLKMTNVQEEVKNHKLSLKKIDADTDAPIKGAVFELWGKWQGNWVKASANTLVTDAKGEIILSENTIDFLIQNGYTELRFKEISVPAPYLLPKGDDVYTDSAKILENEISPDVLTKTNVAEKVEENYTLKLKKIDADTDEPLAGAEFEVWGLYKGTWYQAYAGPFTTNDKGEFSLTHKQLAACLELDYEAIRFKEIKAPNGYELPTGNAANSESSYFENGRMNPETLTMKNKVTSPPTTDGPIIVEKRDKKTGALITDGTAEFVIQGRKEVWETIPGTPVYKTVNGKFTISAETITLLKNLEKSGEYPNGFRIRETKAPAGYTDPEYPGESELVPTPPGAETATHLGEGEFWVYFVPSKLTTNLVIKVKNTLKPTPPPPDETVTLKKVDADHPDKGLPGAVFKIFRKSENGTFTDVNWPIKPEFPDAPSRFFETDSKGQIVLTAEDLKILGDGTFVFYEKTAPAGYVTPSGTDAYSKEFTIVNGVPSVKEIVQTNKAIDRSVLLEKVDADDGSLTLPGAQFVLERQNANESWSEVDLLIPPTDGKGQIKLSESQIASLGEGVYRFKEVTAPTGYDLPDNVYTETFRISKTEVVPKKVTMVNKKTPEKPETPDLPSIRVEKRDAQTQELLKEATFMVQAQRPDDQWSQFYIPDAQLEFTTVNGVAVIDDEEFIKGLLYYSGTPNNRKYRIREIKAPDGYRDPQAPNPIGSREPDGEPGAEFSKEFTIDADSTGVISIQIDNTQEEAKEYNLKLKKVDANEPNKTLAGAQFELWGLFRGAWHQVDAGPLTTNDKGEITVSPEKLAGWQGIEFEGVRFKEIKAPDGYELPTGEDIYTDVSYFDGNKMNPEVLTKTNARKSEEIDDSLMLKKVDADTGDPIKGAVFQIWAYYEGASYSHDWYSQGDAGKVTTNANGEAVVKESLLTFFRENGYTKIRFQEISVPAPYELPTGEAAFSSIAEITKTGITPNVITMQNKKKEVVPPPTEEAPITVEKRDKETGALIKDGEAEFIIQGKNARWEQVTGTGTYKTTNGKFTISAETVALLKNLEKSGDYPNGFRIRETKAPTGYTDPKYPSYEEDLPTPPSDGEKDHLREGDFWIYIVPSQLTDNIVIKINNQKNPVTPPPAEETVVLKKVDADTGKGLAGAEFKMEYRKTISDSWSTVGISGVSLISDENGQIEIPQKFFDGLGDGYYRLREIKAPEGYLLPSGDDVYTEEFQLVNGKPSKTVLTKTNKAINRNLTLKKVSKEAEGIAPSMLSGAEFVLERKNMKTNTWEQVSAEVYTTDAKGEISFDEAKIKALGEGTYRFKETKAPDGYLLPEGDEAYSKEFKITSTAVSPAEIEMENSAASKEFTLQKVDNSDEALPIAGVGFHLEKLVDAELGLWNPVPFDIFVTDAKGQIVLNEAALKELGDGTYRFKEVYVPAGIIMPTGEDCLTDEFTIKDGVPSTNFLEKCNERRRKDGDTEVMIEKRDGDTSQLLEGVIFALQKKSGGILNSYKEIATATTDAYGHVHFTIEETGDYRIIEKSELKGYLMNGEKREFTITEDHFGSLWYVNGKINSDFEPLVEVTDEAILPEGVVHYLNYKQLVFRKTLESRNQTGDLAAWQIHIFDLPGDLPFYQALGVYDKLLDYLAYSSFDKVEFIYEEDGVEKRIELVEGQHFKTGVEGSDFSGNQYMMWNFDPDWLATLTTVDMASASFNITFRTKVSENAPNPLMNDAALTYTNKGGISKDKELGYPDLPAFEKESSNESSQSLKDKLKDKLKDR